MSDVTAKMPDLKCPECPKVYAQFNTLKKHMLECCPQHNARDVMRAVVYNCKHCDGTFKSETSLYRHMKHYCSVNKAKQTVVAIASSTDKSTNPIVVAETSTTTGNSPQVNAAASTVVGGAASNSLNTANLSVEQAQTVIKECEQVIQGQKNRVNTKLNAYITKNDNYIEKLQKLHGMTRQGASQYILNKIHTKQTFDVYKKLFLNGKPEDWAIVIEDLKKQRIMIKVPDGDPTRDPGGEDNYANFHRNMRNSGLGEINYHLETRIIDQGVGRPHYERRAAAVMDELQMDKIYDYALKGNTPKEREGFMKLLFKHIEQHLDD